MNGLIIHLYRSHPDNPGRARVFPTGEVEYIEPTPLGWRDFSRATQLLTIRHLVGNGWTVSAPAKWEEVPG